MKSLGIVGVFLMALAAPAPLAAQETVVLEEIYGPMEAGQATLGDFKWEFRPLIVFADSPNDPAFIEQIALLIERQAELIDRDVVVLFDTDPDDRAPIRQALRPRGFSLVLVDKEGRTALRKPFPWDVRELSRAIDKMPQRQQELRDRRLLTPTQ